MRSRTRWWGTVCAVALAGGVLATADTPVVGPTHRLEPPDGEGQGFGNGGYTVRARTTGISGDTIVVGALFDNRGPETVGIGSAFVFTPDGVGDFDRRRLIPETPSRWVNANIGLGVAVEGDTIVVGSPVASLVSEAEYVFVFRPDGAGDYSETPLLPTDGTEDGDQAFGAALAISGDTIVVGSENADAGRGAAYVYSPDSSGGYDGLKLQPPEVEEQDAFGNSVAISGDTVVVGAYERYDFDEGYAYVLTPDGRGGYERTRLVASDGHDENLFGESVAIEGGTIVVGAPGDDELGDEAGAVYVYTPDGAGGFDERKLTASDGGPGHEFGRSVDISGDTIVIGDAILAAHVENTGTAYVFAPGAGWGPLEHSKLVALDVDTNDRVGEVVGVDGGRAIVNAPGKKMVYVYDVPDTREPDLPRAGFVLVDRVRAILNAEMRCRAVIDFGEHAKDLSGPATLHAGGFRENIDGFTPNAKRTRWSYESQDGGVRVTIRTPRPDRTSRGTMDVYVREWVDASNQQKVAPDTVTIALRIGQLDASQSVPLDEDGRYRKGRDPIADENVALEKIQARLRDGRVPRGKVVAQFATDGSVPDEMPHVRIWLGDPDESYYAHVPDVHHVAKRTKRGWRFTLKGPKGTPGVTSLDLDYVKRRLTLVLRDVELGGLGVGTVPCLFGFSLDGARSAVQVAADHRKRLLYR